MNPDIAQRARASPPLTEIEAAALYDACRTPEMRRALWEIARLQALATELFALVETCVQEPSKGEHAAYYVTERLAAREPCVIAMLAYDWEQRGIPYSRYFNHERPRTAPQPRYLPPRPIPIAPPEAPHVPRKPPEEPEPALCL